MLDAVSRSASEKARGVRPFGKFITRVWEHPLVNQQTREHREEGINRFHSWLRAYHLDPANFIAIPVGSALWSVSDDGTSDHDMLVICRDKSSKKIASNLYSFQYDSVRRIVGGQLSMNFITESGLFESVRAKSSDVTFLESLFLTPDRYIAGNEERAAELRLELLDAIEREGRVDTVWDSPTSRVRQHFDTNMRGWRDLQRYGNKAQNKRTERYEVRMQERASQVSSEETVQARYRQVFDNALSAIQVPDFAIVAQEIRMAGGRVDLIPSYASRGILTDRVVSHVSRRQQGIA